MTQRLSLLLLIPIVLLAGCQYGPREDHGRFKSAALLQDGQLVAFTYHDIVYRPAKGMSAFPDGGLPKYLTDRSLLCTFDRGTQKLQLLLKEKNKLWSNRQGALHIVSARGDAILLSQSGQTRKDLAAYLTRHHLVTINTKTCETFDLAQDLVAHDRQPGALYLIDDQGTMMIVTTALGSDRKSKETPELWVRQTGGTYLKAASTHHYQQTLDRDIIYWKRDDRRYYAFNIDTKQTRQLPDYRPPSQQQVNQGVNIGSSGSTLDYGVRTNGTWTYTPLPIAPETVTQL